MQLQRSSTWCAQAGDKDFKDTLGLLLDLGVWEKAVDAASARTGELRGALTRLRTVQELTADSLRKLQQQVQSRAACTAAACVSCSSRCNHVLLVLLLPARLLEQLEQHTQRLAGCCIPG